jgi:hypothetical protein
MLHRFSVVVHLFSTLVSSSAISFFHASISAFNLSNFTHIHLPTPPSNALNAPPSLLLPIFQHPPTYSTHRRIAYSQTIHHPSILNVVSTISFFYATKYPVSTSFSFPLSFDKRKRTIYLFPPSSYCKDKTKRRSKTPCYAIQKPNDAFPTPPCPEPKQGGGNFLNALVSTQCNAISISISTVQHQHTHAGKPHPKKKRKCTKEMPPHSMVCVCGGFKDQSSPSFCGLVLCTHLHHVLHQAYRHQRRQIANPQLPSSLRYSSPRCWFLSSSLQSVASEAGVHYSTNASSWRWPQGTQYAHVHVYGLEPRSLQQCSGDAD